MGIYKISWWVATQSQSGGTGNIFAVETSAPQTIQATSAIKTGEITGSAVIEVETAGLTATIINDSAYTVYPPSALPVNANMTIIQENVDSAGGTGAIIPYASGLVTTLATVVGGLANVSAILGFGWNDTLVGVGNIIDLTLLSNTSFMMPRDGVITSISGYISVQAALTTTAEITITGQLYQSTTPDNDFTAIPGATVTLSPTISGIISIGDTAFGVQSGLNIPVTAGSRLLLVFTPTVTGGIDIATAMTVYISGGVNIE